jgi:hypothetical protein
MPHHTQPLRTTQSIALIWLELEIADQALALCAGVEGERDDGEEGRGGEGGDEGGEKGEEGEDGMHVDGGVGVEESTLVVDGGLVWG